MYEETLEVLVGVGHEILAIRSKDPAMSIVNGWVLQFFTRGGVQLDAVGGDGLPRRKREGPGFDGVSWRDKIRGRIRNVSSRVRVFQRLLARVHRPRRNMDLLALRDIERLEEGVHVLPAVELTEATKFGLSDRLESIAGTITVDELLNMSRLDLSAVVNDLARWIDQGLGKVESGVINF